MKIVYSFLFLLVPFLSPAQANGQLGNLPQSHPRYLTNIDGKEATSELIRNEAWAKEVFQKLKQRTDIYADKEPEWLTSRLQMYWKTHATDVYIKGEYYDHAGGNKAPAPTVMYTGARNHGTNYARPRIEELAPYQEDSRGMYLANNTLEGKPYEWVSFSKTGNIIQSINVEILGIARDAAFLWWMTREKKYAELASSVFDTYMTGIYYRNVPKDLNHGHQQTLVGMSSFEVIHEDALNALVPLYDFLYDYLLEHKKEKMDIYAHAFKKWADNIIDNGVPHNNWNLIQARFIMDIGIILEDNARYADGKGREYYMDYVLNRSSIRQWSLNQLAEYGFDKNTGIWAECPGYSCGVINDYAHFVQLFDRNLNVDLVKEIPIIQKAVATTPQYLFPNGMLVGFGDTHPGKLRTSGIERMISNAQKHGKREQEEYFTRMLKLFAPHPNPGKSDKKNVRVSVSSFFEDKPLAVDESIETGKIDDYVTPTFYAPNVSWFVQRNGMNPCHSLMVSLNGSEGNHMHANGISMELYGKGLTLGPDAGIGQTLYSGLDYIEYYSQFPAHNTVCVDGISSYPIMKSNHAFKLANCYPASGASVGYQPVSYSDIRFLEPETHAEQNRMTSIVTVDSVNGYYIDIFRSKKMEGGDKTHDYFYHNLGQAMEITEIDDTPLLMKPTEELAFAGAHLYAYSYLFDKRAASGNKDIKTTFTVQTSDGNNIYMKMWMKGARNRKIYSALSPITEGLSRTPGMPYDITKQPTLTFVARQEGEAWKHPFVSVYEPSSASEPGSIVSVSFSEIESEDADGEASAIHIKHRNGYSDHVIASAKHTSLCRSGQMSSSATYSLWRDKNAHSSLLFMGNGTLLQTPQVTIKTTVPANVLLRNDNGKWEYTASEDCIILIDGKTYQAKANDVLSLLNK